MTLASLGIWAAERRLLPDSLVRAGMRRLCARRLDQIGASGSTTHTDPEALEVFAAQMRQGPVAPVPEQANKQHYEVPAAFYALALGKHKKYSSCYWADDTTTLTDAEEHSLRTTCERAGLQDGMDVLELGCGWGSLTLWMAAAFPHARITAVSNSASQRAFIIKTATERNLKNITVVTRDMNDFTTEQQFDRVVSIEMFEHMRNYQELLRRISTWLRPGGRLFVHIFAHRSRPYEFATQGDEDWMAKHFFTGGIMPCQQIFNAFEQHMVVENAWTWDGTHYQKTAEAWLQNLDNARAQAAQTLASANPSTPAALQVNRWRMFFMACAETFGYNHGAEWLVAHYLLAPLAEASPRAHAKDPS